MIPKVVHYCWFGSKDLPPLPSACVESWREKLPDYEVRRWDEGNFDLSGKFFRYHIKRKNWAFVSDLARLLILRAHGGIYLDTDIEVVRSFDDLLDNSCFLGEELPGRPNTAVLACEQAHPFVSKAIEIVNSNFASSKSYLIAPEVARLALKALEGSNTAIRILPEEAFYPYNPFDPNRNIASLMVRDITPETYAVHHWQKSWTLPLSVRFKRRLDSFFSR